MCIPEHNIFHLDQQTNTQFLEQDTLTTMSNGLDIYYQSLNSEEQSKFLQSLTAEARADFLQRLLQRQHLNSNPVPPNSVQPDIIPPEPVLPDQVPSEPVPQVIDPYVIFRGRLENYRVVKVREITPLIWVCEVVFAPQNLASVKVGAHVLVHVWDIVNLSPVELAKINEHDLLTSKQIVNLQNLRIGSWNIRCTGEFHKQHVFFPELLERFERLAIVIKQSECDILALQEFPMNFNHAGSRMEIAAHLLIPEFVIKLNNITCEEWDFGYSEDFPQECWREDRVVKDSDGKPIEEYPQSNGEYIHAFLFKKSKIKMHSVEQVLDITYQENRFKHAPSLGRFTFMENFHFSLCNVHLRPEDSKKGVDARYEIEDLGKCIDKFSKYNPNSTIILGDFNMSACRFAPETGDRKKLTNFLPYPEDVNVWESFHSRNYFAAVKNRYTNTCDDKQFDNIWLPRELESNLRVNERRVVLQNKLPYIQTENVIRLQDVFVGGAGNNEVITNLTDHHLVYADLEVDVAKNEEFIKKVFEIDDSIRGLRPREYNGFYEPPEVSQTPVVAIAEVVSVTPDNNDGVKKVDPAYAERESGALKLARLHFRIWDRREPKPTVASMGGQSGTIHWASSLFPPDIEGHLKNAQQRNIHSEMKELESQYLKLHNDIDEIDNEIDELKKSSGDEKKNKTKKLELFQKRRDIKKRVDEQILPQFERLAQTTFPQLIKHESDASSEVNKKLFK